MMNANRIITVAILAWLACGHLHGATIELGRRFGTANKDAMTFQNNPNNGAGGGPGFFAGTNAMQPFAPRRGLLSFDLASIPSDAIITNVQLRLVIGQIAGSGGGAGGGGFLDPVIGLHKLFVPWGEGNTGASTNNNLGGSGQGNPALAGDVTWNERFSDANNATLSDPWTQPGGQSGTDFAATASASLMQGNDRYDISIWTSTPALVADVQGWVDVPASNNGWMLVNTVEDSTFTFRGFFSRNFNPATFPTDIPSGSTLDEVADFWPVLTVSYLVPEPSSLALLVFVAGVIINRRGQRI